MGISKKVGLDSNILIYALDAKSIYHSVAQGFLNTISSSNFAIYITPQNLNETWSVLTSKTRTADVFSIKDAMQLVDALTISFELIYPSYRALKLHKRMLLKYQIVGSKLYDNFLISTFLSHNIKTFYTNNVKDFVYYDEARVVNPFAKDS